jgi:hypothetical protein
MRRVHPAAGVGKLDASKAARWSALLVALAALLVFAAPAAADSTPPANDDFGAAQTLNDLVHYPSLPDGSPSGKATATNAYATVQDGEPAEVGRGYTVWFKWTAPESKLTIFDTVGSACLGGAALSGCNNGLLTVLSVYTGTGLGDLNLMASNYKCPGATGGLVLLQSCLSFTPEAGHTYYFQVDDRMNNPGDIDLGVPWRGGIVLNWRPAPVKPSIPAGTPSDIGPDGVSHTNMPTFYFADSGSDAFTCTTTNDPLVAYYDPNCGTPTPDNIFKYQTPTLTEGPHAFTVATLDPVTGLPGNPMTIDFTVNTTPPPAMPDLTSTPGTTTSSTSATFAFTSGDATSFHCKLDAGPFEVCSSPFDYSGLSLGGHMFYVYAQNSGGTSETAAYSWTIAPPPPPTPIFTSTPSNPTSSTSVAFSFSSAGATSYTCSLDAGLPTPCNGGTFNSPGTLGYGMHTFSVFASNAGGPSAALGYVWTILPPAPATPIFTSTPVPNSGDTTTSTDGSFSFSSTGATGYTCWLDTDQPAPCNGGARSNSSLGLGPHTFSVYASNAGGNSAARTFMWTVQAPVEDNLPCNSVEGHAHGNQNFQTTVNGKKANVHVEVDGDCDYDKKTGKYFLHHSKVKVEISGAGVAGKLIDAKQNSNGKKNDISGMKLTSGDGGLPTAIINGMWQGIPFVVTLTDGGKGKNPQDMLQVTYPGFPTEVLKAGHNDVHIDFK